MSARRTDIELRAGVDPLEGLLAERARLVGRVSQLRPLFGKTDGWDLQRGIELARIKGLIRAHATQQKEQITVAQIEAEAHAHPQYVAFVTRGLKMMEEWVQVEERLKTIEMTINRDQALLRYVASEPR
jgi:hypothetical protein